MNITAFLLPIVLSGQVPPKAFLAEGSYLRLDYIRSIKQHRSPYKAVGDGGLLQFDVTTGDGASQLTTIANFHNTGGSYRLRSGFTFQRIDSTDPKDVIMVSPSSASRFKLTSQGDSLGEFEFVGSMDDFLRSNTIAGHYLDSQGRKYFFKANGEAEFPDRKFRYTVGCDHFEAPFDYLYGDKFDWAFKFQGDTLELFNHTEEGVSSKPDPKPFLVLKRVRIQ